MLRLKFVVALLMYLISTINIALYLMLSRAQNKYIRSLTHHKFRKELNTFIAEGDKIVKEWLGSDEKIQMIVALKDWKDQHLALIERHPEASVHIVDSAELEYLSGLKSPNQVLIVASIPTQTSLIQINEWVIALDGLQDPGNLGTIIRIADWYGINYIVYSHDCVDVYNPKVVQAAMGGHLRVKIIRTDLPLFLRECKLPILAATLGGNSIYNTERPDAGILVIGNESKGISDEVLSLATMRITIPKKGGAESLNAAVSTGILCALLVGC